MKKTEAKLTTLLLKKLKQDRSALPGNNWVEVKQIERPKAFPLRLLSDKAKRLLKYNVLTHKFSDMSGSTPLDFIHLNQVRPLLCLIWHQPRGDKTAYFLEYKEVETLDIVPEGLARELSILTIKL